MTHTSHTWASRQFERPREHQPRKVHAWQAGDTFQGSPTTEVSRDMAEVGSHEAENPRPQATPQLAPGPWRCGSNAKLGEAHGGSVSRQSSGNRHTVTERSGRAKARPLPIFRCGIGGGGMMVEQGTLRQAFDAHRKHIASTGSASTKASKARAMNLLQHVLKEDLNSSCQHFSP